MYRNAQISFDIHSLKSSCTQCAMSCIHGENLDTITAVTDSSKMADNFARERTGGAVVQTIAQTIP